MYMMFVDESGDPGYPQPGNWSRFGGSTLFIRVGVILHGWKWKTWNERLERLKTVNGLAWNSELKASNIRQGKEDFIGWDRTRRDLFMKDFLRVLGGNPDITIIGVAIDKTKVDTNKCDRIVKPEVRSMEFILERYNMFLRQQPDKSGIVILDPIHGVNDDNIRHFQSYLQAQSPHLRPLHIVEGTFFAKSHTSNMIQAADICSNVFYRSESGARDGAKEIALINRRFWRYNGKIQGYGIKRWP